MSLGLFRVSVFLFFGFFLCFGYGGIVEGAEGAEGGKLRVVVMMGGDEMVGHADFRTAGYLREPKLVLPRKETLEAHKGNLAQINGAYLYWQMMGAYQGEKAVELKRLEAERAAFKRKFKAEVVAELKRTGGHFRGRKYKRYRGFWLYNLCDQEAEVKGITPKIRAILDSPENPFGLEKAYETVLADQKWRAGRYEVVSKLLFGDKDVDVAAYAKAVAEEGAKVEGVKGVKGRRDVYSGLAGRFMGARVSEGVYVAAVGNVEGEKLDDRSRVAQGKLGPTFGHSAHTFGLEYPLGLVLEERVSGPVLIIKCAWGRGDFAEQWGVGGDGGWALAASLKRVRSILGDLGKYHPGYDEKVGYEVAGALWFHGVSDSLNVGYGKVLEGVFGELGKESWMSGVPVLLCGAGDFLFEGHSMVHEGNKAMRKAAREGKEVHFMETYRYYPSELKVADGLLRKRRWKSDVASGLVRGSMMSRRGYAPAYGGNVPYYMLTGSEVGRKLLAVGRFGELRTP